MRFESCYKGKPESGFMTLKIELLHTNTKRTVVLPDDISLAELNDVIQAIIGFNDCHPWEFEKDGSVVCTAEESLSRATWRRAKTLASPTAMKVSSLLKKRGDAMTYTYDPDDRWAHRITRMADAKCAAPRCLKTQGTMCIEDLGGPWGFLDFLWDLKDYDANERHRLGVDFKELLKWSGFGKTKLRKEFLRGPTCDDITKLLEQSLGM